MAIDLNRAIPSHREVSEHQIRGCEGWIDFESGKTGTREGKVDLVTVLNIMVQRAA